MNIIWLIPLFPLIGFLVSGLLYKHIHERITGWFASGMVLLSFIISSFVLVKLINGGSPENIVLLNWINAGKLVLPFEFYVDQLTSLMLMIITGVGFLIHIYSIGYMHGDEGFNRFFSYMNLFIFFMTILVLGGNYLIMFIGWEGVGLCSYLLIGFWNRNNDFNNAARKAFIMNRIGDLGFLLAMFLIYSKFDSLTYTEVFSKAILIPGGSLILTTITLLLFIGATGKSAQIPLLTWLPDAMAGPTPVSALIHAATMVTAGVYMIARSNILYTLAPATMTVVVITGLTTALVAGAIALFQNDIKKVLAYSTISQLGLMFLGLGVGAFSAAMFHLTTHAFFKALLFLAAGSIIHALGKEQDIRNMGGLRYKTPWTFLVFLTGALAISGIPPLSGFFSKDEILAGVFLHSPILWGLGVIASIMTAMYIFRVFWLAFSGEFRGNKVIKDAIFESPRIMLFPMIILAILAAFAAIPLELKNTGSNSLSLFLEPVFKESDQLIRARTTLPVKTNVVLMAVTFSIIALVIYFSYSLFVRKKHLPDPDNDSRKGLIKLVYSKFYFDEIYDLLIVRPLEKLSGFFIRFSEPKIFDGIIEFIGRIVLASGRKIRLVQTGNVGFYLFAMVVFIIIVLLFNILR
jgi:NADH-quinone oxidoreductase subunit L